MDTCCPRCNSTEESVIHCLRDCKVAKDIWQFIRPPCFFFQSANYDLDEWLKTNCCDSRRFDHFNMPWNSVFAFAIWFIWTNRNKLVFESIVESALTCFNKLRNSAKEFWAIMALDKNKKLTRVINIGWTHPPDNHFKLNSDGSAKGNPGRAGAGGVIRDHKGNWIGGYARKLGTTTSVCAELWGLRDGLKLAARYGLSNIIVEVDSQLVLRYVEDGINNTHPYYPIVMDCRTLLQWLDNAKIVHIYREANACADALAKLGADQEMDFVVFEVPPASVRMQAFYDILGNVSPRICRT